MVDGKRPHPPTDSSDEVEVDPNNPINSYHLDYIAYIDQLPIIRKETEELKQTKGMFKCLTHFIKI